MSLNYIRPSPQVVTMSLEAFLGEDNLDVIDVLFQRLGEQVLRVDDYKDLRARFNFITEVVNKRYPDGLPCQPYINRQIYENDNVITADDLDEKPEQPEDCEEFMRRASQVEMFVYERDRKFHELLEKYLNDLLRKDELTFRLALTEHRKLMKYVDERWPENLTLRSTARQKVERRVQEAVARPLLRNFTDLGRMSSPFVQN